MAMPDSSVKPTIIVNADSRFGTTFLSTKYRDHAVAGEVLMDKTTGEIFIKRASDGKIVSFYQNKKMLNDLALDLQVLLLDNPSFTYPKNNENAFYLSTNYDLVAINNETLVNLITDDIDIPGNPNPINTLVFKVSGDSNGFFCRNTSRDADKPFIEFLTNQYNLIFKNYTGNNTVYLTEAEKFQTNTKWETSNAILIYDIDVVYPDGTSQKFADNIDYLRMNDDTVIFFPSQIYLRAIDHITVTIKSIKYDKFHFMINHKDEFGIPFTDAYNKFIPADGRVEVSEFNICHFTNDSTNIELVGNEVITAFLDVPHINRYISKMKKLLGNSQIIVSKEQPDMACIWFNTNPDNNSRVLAAGIPISISSENEANSIIENAAPDRLGAVYTYIGETTENYENGGLYVLEEEN